MVRLVLLVFAFVLFCLAAINVGSPRVNLTAAGLACLAAAELVH